MLSSIRQELWSPSEEQSEKSSSAGPCILKNSWFSTKKLVVGFFLKESYAQEVHTEINNKFSDHEDLLSLEVNTDFSICLSQYLPLRSINLDVLFNRRHYLLISA